MADRSGIRSEDGYSVEPSESTGCVVVFHEVWGLVGHTEDVCKRIGKLGFAAMAPNLYRERSRLLTPTNIQKAMEGVWDLSLDERRDKAKVAQALEEKRADYEARETAAVLYDPGFRNGLLYDALAAVERAHARFGGVTTLGFCMGGGLSLKCATKSQNLRSAISFYGEPPAPEDVSRVSVPILDIHAYQDEIINKKVPGFVEAMLGGGKDLTLKTYPQTSHGFFNDTRSEVYNRSAAMEAWDITRWFLDRTLRRH